MPSFSDAASRFRVFFFASLFLGGLLLLLPVTAQAEEEAEDDEPIEMDRDPEISAEHFEDGEVAREEQRMTDAADSYWKALDNDLENYRAHVRYIQCALAAGDESAEIAADYDKFIEEYPKHLGLKLHRLRLVPAEERLPQLEKLARAKATGSAFDVHLEHGRVLLALDQPKPAVAALTKALALKSGTRPDVLLMLAEAEHASGKTAEAIARLDGAVKANPEAFHARLVLARLQLITGEAESSAAHATTVVEQRPSYIAAFLVKADALASVGTPEAMDEARKTLTSAYRANKEIDDVVLALGDLTARDETEAAYKQATKYYDEVLARDEESWRAMYGKAWVLERLEKWDEAVDLYREVMAVRPSSVVAVNSVGYCLFKQGRVSEAQVQFKRALDMKDDFVSALNNLGATLDSQAKYGDAIKIYERVLKMEGQKENLRALINCAFDYEARGTFPKAQKMLLQAHDILPEDANIVVWIGDNFYFQGKMKDAEKWYQEAIAMDEKSFFAWRGLGLTFAQRKKWSDAIAAV
ncbi:MAG: tetratricopeptide repeat protein, partial [Planctomycetota bacterium]|nr:tetratricopeptide repeat protein [Planctomycetota bacterium]